MNLGHRMLHLDAGIHFDEIEIARRLVVEKFERAGAAIGNRPRQLHRACAKTGADFFRKIGGRRFLPELLTATLERALAFEKVDDIASVAEHLHLDMARALDHLFEIEPAVAKGGFGFGARLRRQPIELGAIVDDADAAPAAAGCRLDHHGIAEARCDLARLFRRVDAPVAAGHGRDAGPGGDLPCLRLVAHLADDASGRPDEDQARSLDGVRKIGILGKEAVPWMHRIGLALTRGGEDRGDGEIGF